jgi:glycosyltransferase involved in cell wall biosynthesis
MYRGGARIGASKVKIAILADNEDSFRKPMAQGLHRMLAKIGVQSTVFYDGLWAVRQRQPLSHASRSALVKSGIRAARQEWAFYWLLPQLRRHDAVVVVQTIPVNFLKSHMRDRQLRRFLTDIPIVLYNSIYLPTRGLAARWLRDGDPARRIPPGEGWGLNRYDWYLTASVVSEYPLPPGCEMYSLIGLDLDDGTLAPIPKGDFVALIDFERPAHLRERAVQISALEETGTKYVVLHGAYPMAEIRRIYQQCSLYFLASRESFGLPICELQACGAYVFTPYADWCPSHWIKKNVAVPGPGTLPPNFIIYNNDKSVLPRQIEVIRKRYDPKAVVDSFIAHQRQFFHGDLDELKAFIHKLQTGQIHAKLHEQHPTIQALADAIGL